MFVFGVFVAMPLCRSYYIRQISATKDLSFFFFLKRGASSSYSCHRLFYPLILLCLCKKAITFQNNDFGLCFIFICSMTTDSGVLRVELFNCIRIIRNTFYLKYPNI